jgi:excinuclease ABC subunit C
MTTMSTVTRQDVADSDRRLPKSPGVYLMKDRRGAVLYVGKAKVLADRVRSYFHAGADHTPKTARMVAQVAAVDYIVTGSELEALILENNLIKKHRPRFNVILQDDKNYPFIRLPLKEAYPRLEIVRRVNADGARYFGPYVPTHALRETLRLLRRLFPLPNCNIVIDGTAPRPCIEYEIKRCLAPCTGQQSQADYHAMIDQVRLFLQGRDTELRATLRAAMERAAADLDFETAARLRDQVANIEAVLEKQRITSTRLEDQDVWAAVRDAAGGGAALQLLFIRAGMVVGRKEFFAGDAGEMTEAELLASAIEHYYGHDTVIPPEIVIPVKLKEEALLARWLGERRGGAVVFRVPQRGHAVDLIRLAEENAQAALAARAAAAQKGATASGRLQQLLGLRRPPRCIEAFDISNLAADQAVGSCVVWDDDRFRTEAFRHFRIKQTEGPDDFGMMAEVVQRRYTLAKDGMAPAALLPDLIVIDGGKGQLSAARDVLQQLGLGELDVIGLAKARGEKFERVFLPDETEPVDLPPADPATHLLQRIRDEAHRFAITYHRKLRGRALVASALDEIPGLGDARRTKLLRHFGSLERLRRATRDQIEAVPGLPKGLARLVFDSLH